MATVELVSTQVTRLQRNWKEFYWVLLGFTGFYWVSLSLSLMTGLDFAEFFQMITGFYWVSVVVQVLHGALLGFTGFYWVSVDVQVLHGVLLGFTRF